MSIKILAHSVNRTPACFVSKADVRNCEGERLKLTSQGKGEGVTAARWLHVWVYCRNNAAVALFILIRAVFFS